MSLPKIPTANVYPSDKLGFAQPKYGGAVAVKWNTFAYTDTTTKELFRLPAGAFVIDFFLDVTTVFNSSGTDLLIVGTVANDDAYVANLSGAALGRTRAGAGATTPILDLNVVFTTETVINAKFTQSVADATTGVALFTLFYIVKT